MADLDQSRRAPIGRLQEQLRALESDRVQDNFSKQDLPTREAFVRARAALRGLMEELRMAELRAIERDLARLEPEIERGMEDLEGVVERLEDAAKVVEGIGRVAQAITRAVAFV